MQLSKVERAWVALVDPGGTARVWAVVADRIERMGGGEWDRGLPRRKRKRVGAEGKKARGEGKKKSAWVEEKKSARREGKKGSSEDNKTGGDGENGMEMEVEKREEAGATGVGRSSRGRYL